MDSCSDKLPLCSVICSSMISRRSVKLGRLLAFSCQQGNIKNSYIDSGHSGGRPKLKKNRWICNIWLGIWKASIIIKAGESYRSPRSSRSNSSVKLSSLDGIKSGRWPCENISYNVTPYDHTSEKWEYLLVRSDSGAYLIKKWKNNWLAFELNL